MGDANGDAVRIGGVTVDALVRDVQPLAIAIEQVPKPRGRKVALSVRVACVVGEQRHATYVALRCQPSQSHTPWPITCSRSLPFSHGNSSVNSVTHCR